MDIEHPRTRVYEKLLPFMVGFSIHPPWLLGSKSFKVIRSYKKDFFEEYNIHIIVYPTKFSDAQYPLFLPVDIF